MSADTFRALCAELLAWADHAPSHYYKRPALFDRARTLLAQPEPEGLTDEELLELMPQQFRDDLATVSRLAAHGAGPDITPGIFRVSLNTGALDYARAVIAADRARRPTPQLPADGVVGELLKWLGKDRQFLDLRPDVKDRILRVAYLLQRQHPQPVAVSERPWEKEAGWRDLDGECWWCPPDGPPYWSLANPAMVYGGWVLPFNALPLPQGKEVES